MATALDEYYVKKAERLARGEPKIMPSAVVAKNAFEDTVAELVASNEAAAVEPPKVMPKGTRKSAPPATQWSSVDVKKVDV